MTIYVAHATPAGPVMQAQDSNAQFVRITDDKGRFIDVELKDGTFRVAPSFEPRVDKEYNMDMQQLTFHFGVRQ